MAGAAFWTEFEQQLEEKNSTSSATLEQQQQRITAAPSPAGAQPVPRTSELTWEEVRIELNRGATSLRPDGLWLHLSFSPSITIHFISSFFCFQNRTLHLAEHVYVLRHVTCTSESHIALLCSLRHARWPLFCRCSSMYVTACVLLSTLVTLGTCSLKYVYVYVARARVCVWVETRI